ncbi:OmpL47-type beta-barrel domain-containing protein [Paenibacillus periandrae]|uniref:OmpL47-type beta-barrel domain-containing protein n=1 Tax=Paenibacillus periandrae TaxID=1761741 RepID=UPI001F0984C5|nr:endonuclease [Paenibacillus periandrae]
MLKKTGAMKSILVKTVLTLSLILPLPAGLSGGFTPVYAEGPSDPAPFIAAKVVNENAGKKILFDNTHGQTAGAADWVIDGGFSDFANGLASSGYDVKELRKSTPITFDDLKDYHVLVIGEANIPYKISEQNALLQYVNSGGSIFFIADHYNADRNKNRWDASEVFNGYRRGAWEDPAKGMSSEERSSSLMQEIASSDWLATNFGVRFRYNALGDIITDQIVAPEQAFGITSGVSTVAMHAGSTLAIIDPTKAKGIVYLPQTNEAWPNAVDQGVYNGGGIAEGPYAAVAKVGAGKAAFIGDSSPVEDATPKYLREETGQSKTTYDGFKEQNDAALLVNTVNWLAKKESYTSLSQVNGLQLDQPTVLSAAELPVNSTEPQAEPWAAPAAGYKWWDASTFKPGSYGGPTAAANPAYGFVKQAQLPNAQEFQIRVTADNLAPGATLSGFSLGIYLTGGTQVAIVQNSDGTWPTSYGYSSAFTLTANSTGHAYKDVTLRVKPGSEGAANLRFRQGSTNLKTESVTLANVAAEPLPPDGPVIPAKISVAEARSKTAGTTVTVEGVVTTEPGSFGGQAFYLQDASGGIYVFQSQAGFHQGDLLSVSAPTALFNGELELTSPIAIKKTGTAALPAKQVVTSLSETNQGQLVELPNVIIKNMVSAAPTGSFEFDAVSGPTTIHVRVDGRTGLNQTAFPYHEGQVVTIGGISSIFKGIYQLKPRGLSDFSADTVAPVTTYQLSETANPNGWFSRDVTVTLSAYDTKIGASVTHLNLNNSGWTTYTTPVTIHTEGINTLKFYSIDAAGNTEAEQSVAVSIDKSAPVVTLTESGQPIHDVKSGTNLSFELKASDGLSGIDQIKLFLDGKKIGLTETIPTSQIAIGSHTVSYRVTDQASNKTEQSFSFQIGTSFETIRTIIGQFVRDGQIKNGGIGQSLMAKLEQAESQLSKGHDKQAFKHVNDLLQFVKNQQENGNLSAKAADVLIQHINYMLPQ